MAMVPLYVPDATGRDAGVHVYRESGVTKVVTTGGKAVVLPDSAPARHDLASAIIGKPLLDTGHVLPVERDGHGGAYVDVPDYGRIYTGTAVDVAEAVLRAYVALIVDHEARDAAAKEAEREVDEAVERKAEELSTQWQTAYGNDGIDWSLVHESYRGAWRTVARHVIADAAQGEGADRG